MDLSFKMLRFSLIFEISWDSSDKENSCFCIEPPDEDCDGDASSLMLGLSSELSLDDSCREELISPDAIRRDLFGKTGCLPFFLEASMESAFLLWESWNCFDQSSCGSQMETVAVPVVFTLLGMEILGAIEEKRKWCRRRCEEEVEDDL